MDAKNPMRWGPGQQKGWGALTLEKALREYSKLKDGRDEVSEDAEKEKQ